MPHCTDHCEHTQHFACWGMFWGRMKIRIAYVRRGIVRALRRKGTSKPPAPPSPARRHSGSSSAKSPMTAASPSPPDGPRVAAEPAAADAG